MKGSVLVRKDREQCRVGRVEGANGSPSSFGLARKFTAVCVPYSPLSPLIDRISPTAKPGLDPGVGVDMVVYRYLSCQSLSCPRVGVNAF